MNAKTFHVMVFDDQGLVVAMFEETCVNIKGVKKLHKKEFNSWQDEGYTWTIEEMSEDEL